MDFKIMPQAKEQTRPQPRAGIMDIEAYVPGKSAAPAGVTKVYKLSSNENPLGASPKAIEAVRDVAARLEFYPDGSALRLREAIAEVHGLNPANIVCSNGSDEIIGLLTQTYLEPGDEGIVTEHGFAVYRIYIQASGGIPVTAKETDERADVDAILACVTERTKIVLLANPNNPTGTYLPFEEIRRLHAGLPKNVLLMLDGAYAEYVRRNDYEAGVELVAGAQNVVMTRTFSKIHGLGGARIGWMYAPAHIVDAINRMRGPFNVNAVAIEAGIAALHDRAHVERTVEHNERWLRWLSEELAEARAARHAERRQFRADPFPGRQEALGGGGGRLPVGARLYPAPRHRLWLPQRAAHDGRHRGSQSRRRGCALRIPEKLTDHAATDV